jgi:HPt (histidine-containing phosphotransfer) domain-containing protein
MTTPSPPLVDAARWETLIQDVGQDVLLALIQEFLATDYETPLKTLATQSPKQQRETLHALKGVAANMGAAALVAMCHRLGHQPKITPDDQRHILRVLGDTRGEIRLQVTGDR